jgi:hypothetical protein
MALFASYAAAISGQEAVDFAKNQNNLVYANETVTIYPNTRIETSNKEYWVLTVLSGDTLSGFIPVNDKTPGLPSSPIDRRELIKTAYVLRYQRQLNENSIKQGIWIFDASNVNFFSNLGQDLKKEKIDLTTLETGLDGFPSLQNQAEDLRDQMDEMYPLAEDISDAILDATSFENEFVAEPDTNKLNEFKNNFLDVFELVSELEQAKIEYDADLDTLLQAIALTGLPIETKQGFNNLATIPTSLKQFTSKAQFAVGLEEQLSSIFDNASVNAENFVADLLTREKRNKAYKAMYAGDSEILEKVGFSSLNSLMGYILDEENFYGWELAEDRDSAKQNWEKAQSFYNAGSFEPAEQYAVKAKRDALKVFEGGQTEPEPAVDTSLLFNGLIFLILAVIVLYALRNRKKIMGLVSPGEEEEEVEINGF